MRLCVTDKWVGRNECTKHASPDYLWEPNVISCDGVTIHQVVEFDTDEGFAITYHEGAGFSLGYHCRHDGVIEYVRLDAAAQ